MTTKRSRVAFINADLCDPKKCGLECKRKCPVQLQGSLCIDVTKESKIAIIDNKMCISCGICSNVCPRKAIKMINIPEELKDKDTTHQYGANGFKLFKMPIPKQGHVLGVIGANGTGKSTVLKILSGKLLPNSGINNSLANKYEKENWENLLNKWKGTELQKFLSKIVDSKLKVAYKPQHIDAMVNDNSVKKVIQLHINDKLSQYLKSFEIEYLINKDTSLKDLSGGELQKLISAIVCSKDVDVYIFDEPTSYLDIRQRVNMAKNIKSLCTDSNYVIVVDHDISILDYMSDYVSILYGVPSAYGVVTVPHAVREGINMFLDGYIPSDNMKFRNTALDFKIQSAEDIILLQEQAQLIKTTKWYPSMSIEYPNFKLIVPKGYFKESQIVVLLGQNGSGKTTFIRCISGLLKPTIIPDKSITTTTDNKNWNKNYVISLKPQRLIPKFEGTVDEYLNKKIMKCYNDASFKTEVIKPFGINDFKETLVTNLSGGEIQRLAICVCLGTPADIYLFDEPSAFLDSEQRIIVAKTIKRFMLQYKKTAFVVEHDIMLASYFADQVILFQLQQTDNKIISEIKGPLSAKEGLNDFLKQISITLRTDHENFRPRVNKPNSIKDKEQKKSGEYYCI